MALRVWLPLNGNLNNQGLDGDITVTNNGAVVNTNGKIGKCYSFTTSQYIELSNLPFSSLTHCSISFWIKVTGKGSSGWLPFTGQSTSYYLLATSAGTGAFYNSTNNVGTNGKFYIDGVKGTTPADMNEWHHYVVTNVNLSTWTKFYINKYSAAWNFAGNVNDVRIYDHVLSPKEVKEISKGLVVHYKLDGSEANGIGGTNLIANGWSGTENWNGTSGISTDVPPNVPGAINSYSNKTSQEYILLHPHHSYTISEYAKRGTSTYNYLYASCIPYDIDKLQIVVAMQPDGFIAASRTTLSQDLNPGDTVVYLTSAAGWTTTSTYAYRIAIFGYKDSTGYTYPDMIYTRKIYAWGSTTDKSHLDKTNNTVTLNAAYTGEKILAGTTVCQTSDGATYYYATSVNTSGHEGTEWFFLTKTFTPSTVNYLKAAKYIRIMSTLYGGQQAAAMTLIDNTAESVIEDTSGYCNNGAITGQLSVSVDSPRYGKCTKYDNGWSVSSNVNLSGTEPFTISLWVLLTTSQTYQPIFWLGDGITAHGICIHGQTANRLEGGDGTNKFDTTKTAISYNVWTYETITWDKSNIKRYVNGVLESTTSWTAGFGNTLIKLYLGHFWAGGLKGNLSDVRVYATALSEKDIQELYNLSAWVDKGGNLNSFQFNDVDENIFKLEYLNEESKTAVSFEDRNGEMAVPLPANYFYYGSGDERNVIFKDIFKPNTQYKFDFWIDYDGIVYDNVNRQGGITIIYTDGTTNYSLTGTGNQTNPIGWQHKKYVSDAGKSIKGISIYYWTSVPAYYRWDSVIIPLNTQTKIKKNGSCVTGQFREDTDIVKICRGEHFDSNQLIEI